MYYDLLIKKICTVCIFTAQSKVLMSNTSCRDNQIKYRCVIIVYTEQCTLFDAYFNRSCCEFIQILVQAPSLNLHNIQTNVIDLGSIVIYVITILFVCLKRELELYHTPSASPWDLGGIEIQAAYKL